MLTINHPDIGELTLNESPRAKRYSIRVLATGKVRLTYPYGGSQKQALKFLDSKIEWVKEALKRAVNAQKIIEMPYSTHFHSLKLNPQPTNKFSAQITDNQLIVTYPITLNYKDESVQTVLKQAIEKLLRVEAKQFLPSRLDHLAHKHGFKYSKVSLHNTRTRWGSCSGSNSISLCISLMLLPFHLIDYILLHELCHTIHKNHGAQFHELLNKVCLGNDKKYSLELRKIKIN